MKDTFQDSRFHVGLLIVLALLLVYTVPSHGEIPEIPVDNEGYVEIDVFIHNQNLQLRRDCVALDMTVSYDQARSIDHGIHGELWERPGSHDLMKDIIDGYGINVVMVRVHGMQEGAFVSDLFLEKDETVYRLDSRPSDAVAIALRTDAPVMVHEDLLHDHGVDVC